MDERRKKLGRRVALARQRAGYSSQKAFADAADLSEKSVADVERGDTRPGKSTLWKIEGALGWPDNGAVHYLETGRPEDLDALPLPSTAPTIAEPRRNYPAQLEDDTERKLWDLPELSEEERWNLIIFYRTQRATKLRNTG
ncbi:helix-turn-helix domain-containing protein [Amycolatopsis methanolica]|uniref:HTH cro/C1-type domain-containing protein n=1 Tax=Amycolatopsis methanolica 239 TaxID=1068978 RepID=A0A076N0S8_AMYME|nr:helix-turn-helix transcriptional regulator [Amycolatopsis methanolica]AIJ26394.1 hypothetical protein AMETH_6302 [Amycolatopsis methanolica 239]AIJ26453.1 hypothetical protein AMETH_6361 [Amycolatopsis methanolica 239]